jgi:hypothetical protein
VHITTSTGVDLETGALQYNPQKEPRMGETVRSICPASPGGKDWQPSAWSPRTRLLYIPHQNLCQDATTYEASYIAGTPFVGRRREDVPGPGGNRGVFTAWDPVAGARPGTSRGLPGLERRAGHRGRRGVLRHHGRLVQGRRRAQRQAAVAVQDRLRDHRPADQLPRPGRQAVRGRAGRRRRLGRRHRLGRPGPARRHRGLGFVNAMRDLPQAHAPRAACCTCSRCRGSADAKWLALLVLACAGAAGGATRADVRVCADPDNLPYSHEDGSGFENRIARTGGADLGLPLEYAWLPDRRGFVRKTMGAGLCDLIIGVPVRASACTAGTTATAATPTGAAASARR